VAGDFPAAFRGIEAGSGWEPIALERWMRFGQGDGGRVGAKKKFSSAKHFSQFDGELASKPMEAAVGWEGLPQ